jgi:hypothetical protein
MARQINPFSCRRAKPFALACSFFEGLACPTKTAAAYALRVDRFLMAFRAQPFSLKQQVKIERQKSSKA